MKKGDSKKKKGFTIIEVSLVIAIAGLIFMMVFVALPQLQRQQRDSRRRDDVLTFLETVKKYQTNNRGALPKEATFDYGSDRGYTEVTWDNSNSSDVSEDNWKGFYRDYLGENFVDPSGGHYSLMVMRCDNVFGGKYCEGPAYADTASGYKDLRDDNVSFPNNYRLYVILQAECDGAMAVKSSNPRKIATLYKMEGAGIYCANT